MPLLEWKNEYRTGFRSIDFEHENMISSINRIMEDADGSKEKLLMDLGEIQILIEAHFALEEQIMRDQSYPAYLPHKQDHDRLLDDILNIMDIVEKDGELDTTAALGERLSAWFGIHFASFDKDLHTMMGE